MLFGHQIKTALYLDLTKYSRTGNNHPWVPLTTEGGRCWLVLLLLHGTLVWFTQTHWYNNNNNNARTIFMVLSSCLKLCESSPRFARWMQHDARWLPTFGFEQSRSAWTISPPVGCQLTTLTIAILLLLSPKDDTHFIIPRRVEGWVNLVGWLHTEMVYPLAHGDPSKY